MSRRPEVPPEPPLARALRRLAANPEALRVAVCVGLLVLGQLCLLGPLGERLASARDDRAEAREQRRMAHAARHLAEELARLTPRAEVSDETSEWQAWVLARVESAGLKLLSFEPRGSEDTRGFRLLEFDVSASARDYTEAVDLVDRLEHGERLLRVEALQVHAKDDGLTLSATLLGMVALEPLGGEVLDA